MGIFKGSLWSGSAWAGSPWASSVGGFYRYALIEDDNGIMNRGYFTTTLTAGRPNYAGTYYGDDEPVVGDYGILNFGSYEQLIWWSEDLTQTRWTKTRTTIDSNVTVAPDGAMTADKINASVITASHYVRQPYGSSDLAAISVYGKKGEREWLSLSFNTTNAYSRAYFDLNNGVVGTEHNNPNAQIEDAGNGWFLCSITGNVLPDTNTFIDFLIAEADNDPSFEGSGSDGLYLWGAQVTKTPVVMPYIKTTTSTITAPSNNGAADEGNRVAIDGDLLDIVDGIGAASAQGSNVRDWTPDFSAPDVVTQGNIISLDDSTPGMESYTSTGFELFDGTNTAVVAVDFAAGTTYTLESNWEPTDQLSSEKVVNGDFDTDTDWTKGTGWTIAAGVATQDGTGAFALLTSDNNPLVVGIEYEYTFDVIAASGSGVRFRNAGGTDGTYRTIPGTYTETLVAGVTSVNIQGVGTVDNVSVKATNQPKMWLTVKELDEDGNVVDTWASDVEDFAGTFTPGDYATQAYDADLPQNHKNSTWNQEVQE